MSKFKVISDGTIKGNRVYDENGCDVSGRVKKIVITLEAGELPKMEMTVLRTNVEIEVESSEVKEVPHLVDVTPLNAEYKEFKAV